jgi:uncharacterized protein (TIGR00725 family)
MSKKTITIFGSSIPKEGDDEFETAYQLGKLLAKNNYNVCTGGYRGIMQAVSKGALEEGGEAIGITVDLWGVTPNKYLTKEIKCNSLFERISKLVETGDAFIILQGGTGTLLELAVVWEFMNKRLLERKPVLCHSKMWQDIVYIMDKQIEKEDRVTGLINYCANVGDMVEYLSNHFRKNHE